MASTLSIKGKTVVQTQTNVGGKIVADESLILYLDAANPESYPGSGNIWYDLTSYKQNATLYNSPTFDISGVRSIQFDGMSQYAETPPLSPSILSATAYSVSVWFNCIGVRGGIYSSTNPTPFAGWWLGMFPTLYFAVSDISEYYYFNNSGEQGFIIKADTPNNTLYGYWVNLTFVASSTNNRAYINGVLKSTWALSPSPPAISTYPLSIGRQLPGPGSTTDMFWGNIATLCIYNKTLSDQEVLQNFEALKSRFGYF